jgi:hypothetical protein
MKTPLIPRRLLGLTFVLSVAISAQSGDGNDRVTIVTRTTTEMRPSAGTGCVAVFAHKK